MKRYTHHTMQPVFASIAASLACVATLAALVILPAAAPASDVTIVARKAVPIEVAIEPNYIEVVGTRDHVPAGKIAAVEAGQS